MRVFFVFILLKLSRRNEMKKMQEEDNNNNKKRTCGVTTPTEKKHIKTIILSIQIAGQCITILLNYTQYTRVHPIFSNGSTVLMCHRKKAGNALTEK